MFSSPYSDFHCALLRFIAEMMQSQDEEALNQLSRHYKDFKLLTNDFAWCLSKAVRTIVCVLLFYYTDTK